MTLCRVIFPTHNRLEWLKESVDSVLWHKEVELWILANGCTDGTDEYLSELAEREPRLHYFTRSENLRGGYYWLIQQFPNPDGYLCLFSDDDHMLPYGLERKRKVLDDDWETKFVFSRVRMMNEEGEDLGPGGMGAISSKDVLNGAVDFRRLIKADYVPTPTVVMKTAAFWALLPILEETTFALCDWQLWLHAANMGFKAAYIAEPTVRYRVHGKSDSTAYTSSGRYIEDHLAVWRHWANHGYRPWKHELLQIEAFALQIAHSCGVSAARPLQELNELFAADLVPQVCSAEDASA